MTGLAIAAVLAWSGAARAAEQMALDGGFLFEAEAYDRLIRGAEFGVITDEALASGGKMLTGMYREGAITYRLSAPEAATYAVWLRYAAPGNASLRLGFDTVDEAQFITVNPPMTSEKLDAPNAYGWARLTHVELQAGAFTFAVGQGALREDCFLFTPDLGLEASDDVLARLQALREQPKGTLLPELTHSRTITQHPQWLRHALRPCYAHFEWDPNMTADEWSRRASEAGANCLIGAGEMPAGTLNGKLKAFGYGALNQDPPFTFPEGYDLSYGWAREFADAAHAHGLRIAIYGGAFRTLDPLLVEHPEWRQVDAQGRPYANGFGSWHSPYRQAYIQRWVDVAKLSGFDGIMIDMLFTGPPGGDYSEYTVNAFRERFGIEPPREADFRNLEWQRWIDFQSWTREEMLLDLTEALHAVSPEIAVIINQTEGWIFQGTSSNFLTTRVAKCVDGLLEEMGWDYRHNWKRPWAWPASSAWQNLFLRCRTRPGYGQMWHMILNFPSAHVQALSYSMLANGTAPAVVTGGNWPDMTEVWRHTQACEPWVEETELSPWMALHFSEDTLDWYANARGEETYTAYLESVFGVFQAALETHLPIEIITDDDLANVDTLRRYATVCLPNSACLSNAQAAALEAYVGGGGGLVATYETGRYDENGTLRETPALQSLLGVTQYGALQATTWSLRVQEGEHPILDHPDIRNAGDWNQGQSVPAAQAYLYTGPASRTVGAVATGPADGGAFSAPLLGAADRRPPGAPESCVFSTVVASQRGQGKVAYFPVDLGHAYYVFNHPLNRRLIERALTWTAAYPNPLRTDALMSVQTVPYHKGDAAIVHLVNDNSSFGRAAAPNPEAFTAFRAEVAPVHDVTVGVQGHYTEALLLPEGTQLPVRSADGFSEATVPRVDVHAIVVFR